MHIAKHGKAQWRVIVQHDGKRRSAVARTKADAQRRGAELLLELGTTAKSSDVTVGELIDMHIEQTQLAATTRADYQAIRDRLPGWFADWPVTTVTPHMIDQAYQRLTRDGWSAHRLHRLHSVLRPSFRRAQRWGWITGNPALAADPPTLQPAAIHAPSAADVMRLIAAADEYDPMFGCALRVAAATGVRRGELCALQWDDLDIDAGELTVRRSVATVAGQPFIVTEGKTGAKGHRTIALDPFTIAALTAHSAQQAATLLGRGQSRPLWVFTADGVNPWRTDYVTLTYGRLRDNLGLQHVRLHDLRHFAATQLLGGGVDVRTVAGRLGHARASTTLNKYATFLPARDREAADIMGRLLGGT